MTQASAPNWTQLHEVLATTQAALAHDQELSPAEVARILDARARTLAQVPTGAAPLDVLTVIAFRLGGETYGIEATYLREVVPLKELTTLPGTPPFICGILNLRGQIRSVMDLLRFLDLPSGAGTVAAQVLIVQSGAMELGIRVESVLGVQVLAVGTLQPPPTTLGGRAAAYCRGVAIPHLTMLDVAQLLADPAILVNQAI
jgi:purine-binding chemotaxis protein CheW